MQNNEYLMTNNEKTSDQLKASILNTLSSDPHLTDIQLIELVSGISPAEALSEYQSHLQHCTACASVAEQLNAQLAIWQNPVEIERLEARIGRPAVMSNKAAQSWWTQIAEWVSIAPLGVGKRVNAAPMSAMDTEVINFPIHVDTEIALGLSGIIQRRGQEYQIKITPSVEQTASYKDRLVEVVLVDSGTEDVLLQRNIPINRFVLLGTGLPIRTERIAAKLIT